MTEKSEASNRRDFLKLAAVGAPAAALAATPGTAEADELAAGAGEGLRRTEHVRKYFETARF